MQPSYTTLLINPIKAFFNLFNQLPMYVHVTCWALIVILQTAIRPYVVISCTGALVSPKCHMWKKYLSVVCSILMCFQNRLAVGYFIWNNILFVLPSLFFILGLFFSLLFLELEWDEFKKFSGIKCEVKKIKIDSFLIIAWVLEKSFIKCFDRGRCLDITILMVTAVKVILRI